MPRKLVWVAVMLGGAIVALAQTTLNMSADLVRLGIASSNMIPNRPILDSGRLFEEAVRYAQQHQIANVVADPGAYYFLSVPNGQTCYVTLPIGNALTIDLQGSDLYFADLLHNNLCVFGANAAY